MLAHLCTLMCIGAGSPHEQSDIEGRIVVALDRCARHLWLRILRDELVRAGPKS